MSNAMMPCAGRTAMRHDPASGAIIVMMRSLKMHGMAQAVTDVMEQARQPLMQQFRSCPSS